MSLVGVVVVVSRISSILVSSARGRKVRAQENAEIRRPVVPTLTSGRPVQSPPQDASENVGRISKI